MVKPVGGLGSCDLYDEKMASAAQGQTFKVDGQKLAAAGLQEGRITLDCLEKLKTDAERQQFLIENTNWFLG